VSAIPRPPFGEYRQRLAAVGFRPSRRLGQNFLLDPALHAAIAAAADLGPGDVVLEVGAGLGFLTRVLADAASSVVAVEVDRRLFGLLEQERSGWGSGAAAVRLVSMDALASGRWNPDLISILDEERAQSETGAWRLVANLPYSITGPLLGGLVQLENPPAGGAVLVQEEVARRLVAEPGTAEYGALTVQLQAGYELRLARRVGREVFWPRPAVGSAVVAFARRETSAWITGPAGPRRGFARFVRGLFGQRRKKLSNALPGALRAAALDPGALPPLPAELAARRPASLPWAQILEIWTLALGSS
jgi:16S rRNA (adenine1518-N6/adenine1519-N6)-dimethyltransferase